MDGLASLLKNPPGILPEAYIFSIKSTVNGKKSVPSLGSFAAVAVTRTLVSPYVIKTAPFACFAILPVSIVKSLPAISIDFFLMSNLYIYSPFVFYYGEQKQ